MASPAPGRHEQPSAISGRGLHRILTAGLVRLEADIEDINRLNVFPIPDRDTGTNMFDTLRYTLSESDPGDRDPVGTVAAQIAERALFGARGNSGVILAEFLRGFARELLGAEGIDVTLLSRAFRHGAMAARAAVESPAEGTILTVMNDTARATEEAGEHEKGLGEVLTAAAAAAEESLQATPQLLAVLRESGVVDAGAAGFVAVIDGMARALEEGTVESPAFARTAALSIRREGAVASPPSGLTAADRGADDRGAEPTAYGYCTGLLVRSSGAAIETEALRNRLSELGGSLIVIGTDRLLRIHVHASDPGAVLSECLKQGALQEISIRNMDDQALEEQVHSEELAPPEHVGVVAVAEGNGFSEIFQSLGAAVVEATDHDDGRIAAEVIEAVGALPNVEIVILPNRPAGLRGLAERLDWRGKRVRSADTSTMPAGIAALIELDPAVGLEANLARMNAAAAEVHTVAIEESQLQFSVTLDGNSLGRSVDLAGLLKAIVGSLPHGVELATVYYSQRAEQGRFDEVVEAVRETVGRVELHFGGQAIPLFLVSLE